MLQLKSLCIFAVLCIAIATCNEDKKCPPKDKKPQFSALGMTCSSQNDAYVLGLAISSATSKLPERWKAIAYLEPPSRAGTGSSDSENCKHNERLAIQKGEDVIFSKQCDPFELTYCRMEYYSTHATGSIKTAKTLRRNSICDCNYLYAVKRTDSSGKEKCYAKAGVPCKFKQLTSVPEPDHSIPNKPLECDSQLKCTNETDVRIQLQASFHGIGMNPIAHEVMVATATAYCDCNSPNLRINAVNECVRNAASKITVRIDLALIFTMGVVFMNQLNLSL